MSGVSAEKGGSSLPQWRKLVCGMMTVMLQVSAMPQDSSRAMLHSDGSVLLNGTAIANSSALFPHDVVQTPKDVVAKIDAEGSTVTILPETVLQFEGDEIVLDHGSVQLNTEREMKVRVNCITVIPVLADWTQFDLTDMNGKVTVAANQRDVKIHSQTTAFNQAKQSALADIVVHQSEKASRDERCGATRPASAINAKGAILNSVWLKAAGAVAIGITCVVLCRGSNPISPDQP
jgi:hypothetical protein